MTAMTVNFYEKFIITVSIKLYIFLMLLIKTVFVKINSIINID